VKGKANDKVAEAQRKAHEKICQGHHGTVTAKTDNSITIDGKRYAFTADTRVNKQEEPLLLKAVKVATPFASRRKRPRTVHSKSRS